MSGSKPSVPVWPVPAFGIPMGLLAVYDPTGVGVWWALVHGAALVWGLPYVAAGVTVLAALAVTVGVVVVGVRAWRRWGR